METSSKVCQAKPMDFIRARAVDVERGHLLQLQQGVLVDI
jgi:hypothetical protein